jgi:glycosyltransferase involved in cell wall biosynthesis
MTVTIVTHFPSPYQVELFDRVARCPDVDLTVMYLHRRDHDRAWREKSPEHQTWFLDPGAKRFDQAVEGVRAADVVVFNYYNDIRVQKLLNHRAKGRRPWAFWGERPGFRHPLLGRLARLRALRHLHGSQAPVWGIGRVAVDAYRREFGKSRAYLNLPYFSDLDPFRRIDRRVEGRGSRTLLFSGALIERKGILLLARAFLRIQAEYPALRLVVMGDGPMRGRVHEELGSVHGRVEFLGFRDWDALPDAYASAQVLCVPSLYDGWGLVVPEGMAAGMPVIATDQMGAGLEFVQHGRNGWLIAAGDETALVGAIREAALLSDAVLLEMAARARETVARHGVEEGATRLIAGARSAIENWKA